MSLTFKFNIKTRLIFSVILFILGIFIILQISLFQTQDISQVQAAVAHKVRGWGWSENIGWISMNCYNDYPECNGGTNDGLVCTSNANCPGGGTCEKSGDFENCCPGGNAADCPGGLSSDYGVHYNTTNGKLIGYAWSDGVGWICFGESCQTVCLGGSNNGGTCSNDGDCSGGVCGGKPSHGLPVSWACVGRPAWTCQGGSNDGDPCFQTSTDCPGGLCRFGCSDDDGEDFVDSSVCVRSSHLKAHWKINSLVTGTTLDESNSNTGTLMPVNTPPIQAKGKFSNALQFDGTEDYIEAADSASLSITGNLTIEAWVKRGEIGTEQTIVGKWDESTGIKSYRLWFSSNDNKLNFTVSDGTNIATAAQKNGICVGNSRKICDGGSNNELPCNDYTAANDCLGGYCREPFCVNDAGCQSEEICKNAPITDTTKWHHITGKYVTSANNPNLYLFIDGSPIHAGITGTIPNSLTDQSEKLYIGAKKGSSVMNTYFKGVIDNVSVWSCQNVYRTKGRSNKEIWDDARIEIDGWGRVINLGEKGWLKLRGLTKDGRVWGSSLDDYSTFYILNGYMANRWVDESGGNEDVSTTGLVAYYKMNETSWNGTTDEVIDSSGNGNDGKATCRGTCSVPTTGAGKFGKAGDIDGVDDSVTISSSTLLKPTSQITVAAWIYPHSPTDYFGEVIQKNDRFDWRMRFEHTTGEISFWSDTDTSGGNARYETPLTANNWYHIVGIADITKNKVYIYVNGELKDDSPLAGTVLGTSNGAIMIGTLPVTAEDYDGLVDEVRIYNRALSSAEVSQLYNWAPGPVGLWKMNEPDWTGSNNTVVDSSANTNTGTAYNGANITKQGIFNSAGDFDGDNDYINVSNNVTLDPGSGSYTGMAWIKTSISTGNAYIFGYYEGGETDRVEFRVQDGKIRILINDNGNVIYRDSLASVGNGLWHHVAFVWNTATNTLDVYVDGSASNGSLTGTPSNIGTIDPAGDLSIGRRNNNESYFNGFMDNVAIYDRALPSTEIQEAYNKSTPACVGWEDHDHDYDDPPEPLDFNSLAVNNPDNCEQLLVYWDPSEWAEDYTYWRDQQDGIDLCGVCTSESTCETNGYTEYNVLAGSCTESECSLSDTGLSSNTGYCYNITAYNETGSTWATDTPPTYPAPYWRSTTLCAPENLASDADTCGQVTLTWDKGTSVDGYNIYRSLATGDCDNLYNSGCELTGHLAEALDYDVDNDDTNDLIAQWKMNESSWNGTNKEVKDSSAQTPLNHGTADCHGTCSVPTTTTGIFDKAGSFDGVDDYVDLNKSIAFGTGDFTIEGWVYASSSETGYGMLIGDYSTGKLNFYASNSISNSPRVELTACDSSHYLYGGMDIRDAWHHIALTRASGTIKLWVDGAVKDTDTCAGDTYMNNPRIGSATHVTTEVFNGLIDNVVIYDVAKTAEQIRIDYESGINSNCESGQCGLAYVCDGASSTDKCGANNTCCYTDSRIIPYVNYYYRVTATGETGETPSSTEIGPAQTICFPAPAEEEE